MELNSTRSASAGIVSPMRSTLYRVLLVIAVPWACSGQKWEVGGAGGYGWYVNPSLVTPVASAEAGLPPRGLLGAVFGNDMYEHLGGEVRYLFQFGGPQVRSGGVQVNLPGHTNLINYDFLVHLRSRDEKLRPFFAGGAGIKVFTNTADLFGDGFGNEIGNGTLSDFVRFHERSQVEPVISAGAGLKYRMTKHAQVRVDFRTYFSPLPDEIFRVRGLSRIHGWVYNFVPMAGISYVF